MLMNPRTELEKWSHGKPFLLAAVAQQIAFSADAVIGMLDMLHNDGLAILRDHQVPQDEWLTLYTRHRVVNKSVVDVLGGLDWETLEGMRSGLVVGGAMPKDELRSALAEIANEEWGEIFGAAQQTGGELFECHLQQLLTFDECTDADCDSVGEQFLSKELQFFMRVAFPCWIETGELPSQLLYRASRIENPDLAALEALVALDKSVLHHPRLAQVLHPKNATQERNRLEAIGKAISGPAVKAVDRKRVKCCLAGLISQISDMLVHRLNATEIRHLFDVAAKQQGELRDFDLPDSPESFQKAIQRQRKFWKTLPTPDKDYQYAVRALRELIS